MAAKVYYIPGTKIPKMEGKAGIRARLAGTRKMNKMLQGDIKKTILDVMKKEGSPTGDVAKVVTAIKEKTIEGIILFAYDLNEDMNRTPPLVPVDTGTLKDNYKITVAGTTNKPSIIAGWSDTTVMRPAKKGGEEAVPQYAAYVHEMTVPPYKNVKWTRPGSGPKFLEEALKRNANKLKGIIGKRVRKIL